MEIDWEQRRYEVAKEMLAAINSNSKFQNFGIEREDRIKLRFGMQTGSFKN